MQKFWNYLSLTGTQPSFTVALNRHIILCNRLSLVIAILTLLIGVIQFDFFRFGLISIIALICICLSTVPVLLNASGLVRMSRLVFCFMLPTLPLAISIFAKSMHNGTIGESFYYDYRYILLGLSIIPPMLFSLNEKALLFSSILLVLASFIFFDPLHELFNVGYYQVRHSSNSYPFSGSLAILIFMIITASALVLKNMYEGFEKQNEELIEELTKQTDLLNNSQEKLQLANTVIQKQKELLQIQNRNLESELVVKNKNLTETNTELIKYNTELRQFSYTVSHNLRGPVASLMGLLHLVDPKSLEGENAAIIKHSVTSINKLDATIRDLGKIIDIRNDIFRIRQQISLHAEMEQVNRTFEKEILAHHVTIKADFSKAPIFYSVRPMVASILYNLVSNSIKYRSPEREPKIEITSDHDETHFILIAKDNGLGIDTQHHKENLFRMYKRFHQHTEGKGLGLYLVKLQAESLGGSVEIMSEVNQFTQFTVRLKKPENVERQVLYQEPHAQIFFDARTNSTGIIWNGPVTSNQFRMVFTKCLEFLKAYNTPNYIADLSRQGVIEPTDQKWVFTEIMPDAVKNGLKRIAAVQPEVKIPEVAEYLQGINKTLNELGVSQFFFSNMKEAVEWVEIENEKIADQL